MATCFSILAWEIPWTEEPGKVQSMGLQKTFSKGLTTIRMAKIWNSDNTNACLNGEQQELSFIDGGNAK